MSSLDRRRLRIPIVTILSDSHCVPVLDYSKTSDYAPGETTKKYHDHSPEVKSVKDGHTLGKVNSLHLSMLKYRQQTTRLRLCTLSYMIMKRKSTRQSSMNTSENIDAIKQYVAMLKTGEVKIGAIKDATMSGEYGKTQWRSDKTNPKVHFGTLSYSTRRTAQDTAGTLLHEASYALWQTKDHYSRHPKNGPLIPIG